MKIDLSAIPPATLEQYVGLWAIDEAQFMSLCRFVSTANLADHITNRQWEALSVNGAGEVEAAERTGDYRVAQVSQVGSGGRIAMITIRGSMTKQGSSLSDAGSTVRVRREVRAAAADESIDAIILRIDSPGGTVSGTADLASDVRAAAEQKKVVAYIEDLGASAAYWVASQASEVYANNATALVGSIGTLIALYDLSGLAAKEGIRPVVIKTGTLKGAGFPGSEITEEFQEALQDLVDKTQTQFSAAVQSGRGLSAAAVAEIVSVARIYNAQDAVDLKLIDGIKSLDAIVGDLQSGARRKGPRSASMETKPTAEGTAPTIAPTGDVSTAATYEQVKTACVGADAAFICGQLDKKATIDQARTAWMAEQNNRLAAKTAEAEQAKSAAKKPPQPGQADGLGTGGSDGTAGNGDGCAMEQWNEKVDALVGKGMSRNDATRRVARENPELRTAMLIEHNTEHGRTKAAAALAG